MRERCPSWGGGFFLFFGDGRWCQNAKLCMRRTDATYAHICAQIGLARIHTNCFSLLSWLRSRLLSAFFTVWTKFGSFRIRRDMDVAIVGVVVVEAIRDYKSGWTGKISIKFFEKHLEQLVLRITRYLLDRDNETFFVTQQAANGKELFFRTWTQFFRYERYDLGSKRDN